MLRTLAGIIGFASLLGISACADARCDPNPVGEPWKPYESLLPDNAVVCGPNRHSAKKPSDVVDNYPPTGVFVFYEDKSSARALLASLKKLEAAGWQTFPEKPIGEGPDAIYKAKATKGDATIFITVNRNDWGTQGSFGLKTK
jgi:hypothetical protein